MALRPGFYLRLLRAEGLSGLWARLRVRRAYWRNRASYRPARPSEVRALGLPLLNVLPVSRDPLLGGVQVQLAQRLASEGQERPVGLVAPERDRYWLEAAWQQHRLRLDCGPAHGAGSLGQALAAAFEASGASGLHAENLAAFAAHGLLDARPAIEALLRWRAGAAFPLVVSLHEYAVFCPRPFQIERPQETFCGFSRDLERCERCLANVPGTPLEGLRPKASALLAGAAAVVCPSAEMRARLLELFPGPSPSRVRAIAPSSEPQASYRAARWPPRHAAIVGATRLEKGAQVAAELAPLLRALGLSVSAFGGGGDPRALLALRRAGARPRGSYVPGSLPQRLLAAGADLAIIPTIGPETHSLVLDECWAAGLAVVAFDVGAPAARLRELGGGRLVSLETGAAGLAAAVQALSRESRPPVVPRALPSPAEAARAHLELYRELGLIAR